jgi:hypothetical protein
MRNRIRVTPGVRDWEASRRWALTLSQSAGSARVAAHERMSSGKTAASPRIAAFPQDQAGARWRKTLRLV